MKRIYRFKEIEKLWKSRTRDTDWEQITWDPFTVEGHPYNLVLPSVAQAIESDGYYFWMWGLREEASGSMSWEWALLELLHTWYCLPEDCDAPLFVNEHVWAICIPNSGWANSLALLFQHPASVLLGMEHMEAEKAAREAPIKAEREANPLAYANSLAESRKAALAFMRGISKGGK